MDPLLGQRLPQAAKCAVYRAVYMEGRWIAEEGSDLAGGALVLEAHREEQPLCWLEPGERHLEGRRDLFPIETVFARLGGVRCVHPLVEWRSNQVDEAAARSPVIGGFSRGSAVPVAQVIEADASHDHHEPGAELRSGLLRVAAEAPAIVGAQLLECQGVCVHRPVALPDDGPRSVQDEWAETPSEATPGPLPGVRVACCQQLVELLGSGRNRARLGEGVWNTAMLSRVGERG